jgi:hypothetical protein
MARKTTWTFKPWKFALTVFAIAIAITGHWTWAFIVLFFSDFEINFS